MAQLKDTIVHGDLDVQGKTQTSTQIDEIGADIIKVEFAELIDPGNLNEEVTLVTIPTGYVGRLSHLGQIAIIGITYHQNGSVSQDATATIYYTPEPAGVETTVVENININKSSTIALVSWIAENSTIRAKITVAGVGHTSKILLEGIIYLQKI